MMGVKMLAPWQLTKQQWEAEFSSAHPANAPFGRATRSAGNELASRMEKREHLRYGVHDAVMHKLSQIRDGIVSPPRFTQLRLLAISQRPVTHERVIRKALTEGLPVPAHVLVDYPNLHRKEIHHVV